MKNLELKPGDLCLLQPELYPTYPDDKTRLHGIIVLPMLEQALKEKDADKVWDAMEFFSGSELDQAAMFLNDIHLKDVFPKHFLENDSEDWFDDHNCTVLFQGRICLTSKTHLVPLRRHDEAKI